MSHWRWQELFKQGYEISCHLQRWKGKINPQKNDGGREEIKHPHKDIGPPTTKIQIRDRDRNPQPAINVKVRIQHQLVCTALGGTKLLAVPQTVHLPRCMWHGKSLKQAKPKFIKIQAILFTRLKIRVKILTKFIITHIGYLVSSMFFW